MIVPVCSPHPCCIMHAILPFGSRHTCNLCSIVSWRPYCLMVRVTHATYDVGFLFLMSRSNTHLLHHHEPPVRRQRHMTNRYRSQAVCALHYETRANIYYMLHVPLATTRARCPLLTSVPAPSMPRSGPQPIQVEPRNERLIVLPHARP